MKEIFVMAPIKQFVAEDGAVFDDERACKQHEQRIIFTRDVWMVNWKLERTTELFECAAARIASQCALNAFIDKCYDDGISVIYDERDLGFPKFFVYDERGYNFYAAEEVEMIQALIAVGWRPKMKGEER